MMMAEAATPQEFKAFLPNSKKDSEEEAEVQTEKVARDQDWFIPEINFVPIVHGVWKSQKKYHSTFYAYILNGQK